MWGFISVKATLELEYVRMYISSNTRNVYTAENQEERLSFNETAFLSWCHVLWKLGSSNCCIFEMKYATGMGTSVGGLQATRSLSVEVPAIWVYILLFFNLYSSSYVTNLNYSQLLSLLLVLNTGNLYE